MYFIIAIVTTIAVYAKLFEKDIVDIIESATSDKNVNNSDDNKSDNNSNDGFSDFGFNFDNFDSAIASNGDDDKDSNKDKKDIGNVFTNMIILDVILILLSFLI